jgi:hypothetical protein
MMPPSPRRLLSLAALTLALGCQSVPPPIPLSSLRQSGEVTFLCLDAYGRGAPLSRCPQGPLSEQNAMTTAAEGHELFALVTQTISGEVAVVRVTGVDSSGYSTARVVDVDPTNPGVTHLRVGEEPRGIATTPGGLASFVGVGEIGQAGIFALPTSCILPPNYRQDGTPETVRDLTTWPACSLSSAPGDIRILVDPLDGAGGLRTRCDADYTAVPPTPAAGGRVECAADLYQESVMPGARKLVVSLPEEGRLLVLDAQALLDREPASFRSCLDDDVLEASLPLEVDLPSVIEQPLPKDLAFAGCSAESTTYGPFPGPFSPRPANMDDRDGWLLVADENAPVVHVFGTEPCSLSEGPPLVLTSFAEPQRVVTSKKVAISPRTASGGQFAYVVDERGGAFSSIAVFDLTPGQISRTPLMRPYSADMLQEPPDRITFGAPVKDVAFAYLDRPGVDPTSQIGVGRIACDPDPAVGDSEGGGIYRPASDFESGAQPAVMRGLFGYALLSSGSLAMIDVEDLDAPCRRPIKANSSTVADLHGCQGDPAEIPYFTQDRSLGGDPTVTDELSCNIVLPHRVRSDMLMFASDTVQKSDPPSLSAFGRLSLFGRGLPTSRLLAEGRRHPIVLGVDFEAPPGQEAPAEVYVGSTVYSRQSSENELVIDPNRAEQSSIVLPYAQPRAYPTTEVVSITYEGDFAGVHATGLLAPAKDGDPARRRLLDPKAAFCGLGVQDRRVTAEVARERFELGEGATERFVSRHTDYLQVTGALLGENDSYWTDPDGGQSCGAGRGFLACDVVFGQVSGRDLPPARDFRVLEAYQGELLIESRDATGDAAEEIFDLLSCCFPGPLTYRVRAGHQWVVRGETSGYAHPIIATEAVDPETGEVSYPCTRDCHPIAAHRQGRVFEVTSVACEQTDPADDEACGVGPRTDEDVVCGYDSSKGQVAPGGAASECIFDAPNRRFVIYRGLDPSEREMVFGFEVAGGFRPKGLVLTTVTNTNVLLPVSMTVAGEATVLGVVDSQDRGLIMVDLRNSISPASFY